MTDSRYSLLGPLTAGGPWLAQDEHTGRLVVHKHEADREEADALAPLGALAYQPGRAASLPGLLASFPDKAGWTLVRPFLPGRTLQELLVEGPLAEARVGRWILALARLLEEIHALGRVHGDLSADNILVTPAGELVLLDWGGGLRSTPIYAAPEKGPPDPSQDVYALGMLWLHALNGRPSPARDLPPNAPPELSECLSYLPDRRPTAHHLAERLRRYGDELFENLAGRVEALARVEAAWGEGTATHSLWIGLAAPSGHGKTAFLREVTGRCQPWAWGQVSTLSTPQSFEAFQSLAGTLHLDGLALPDSLRDTQHWRLLEAVFPWLAGPSPRTDAEAGPLSMAALTEAWSELLTRLVALRRRLLLVFDDIQWMDEQSRQLLGRLSERNIPGLLVIAAWRQEHEAPPELRLHERLQLAPLTVHDLRRWAQRDGQAFGLFQAYAAQRWSHGSPLLLRDWLRAPDELIFSPKVATLLEDRLGSLDSSSVLLLGIAALRGKVFELSILRQLEPDHWESVLEHAVRMQLLLPGQDSCSFAHDRVRERILERLSEEEKTGLHSRLADFFLSQEPLSHPDCAHHLALADRAREAAPHALLAARHEASRLALDSARRFYAMHLASNSDLQAVYELAVTCYKLGRTAEAVELLERELTTCTDLAWRNRSLVQLHWLFDSTRQFKNLDHVSWRFLRYPSWENVGHFLHAQLIYNFQEGHSVRLGAGLALSIPYLAFFWRGQAMLAASVLSALPQLGWMAGAERASAAVLATLDRQADPSVWACVLSRLDCYRNSQRQSASYVAQLEELDQLLMRHANPEEVCKNGILLGNYYLAQGRFAELAALGKRLDSIADQDQHYVAAFHRVASQGGRVSWSALERELQKARPLVPNLAHARLAVAAAMVLLDRGEPQRGLAVLDEVREVPALFDSALLHYWRATAARKALQSLPRHQRGRREKLRRRAWDSVTSCLKQTFLLRVYLPQALRERAWLRLLDGQPELARRDLERSLEEAEEAGSRYEEALTLRDLGRIGRELGWPQAESHALQAQSLLSELGAWWELFPAQPGLPLEEVGEAATGCLHDPDDSEAWARLRGVGAHHLASELLDLLEEHRQRQGQAQRETRALEQENELWQEFLARGPVLVERRDAGGRVLESNLREVGLSEEADGVSLSDGTQVYLEVPPQRVSYPKMQRLLELERRLLLGALQRDARADWPSDLLMPWQGLRAWYLQDELPEAPDLRSFLELAGVEEKVPLSQLPVAARQTLLGVVREALNNSLKYGTGKLQVEVRQVSPDWLVADFRDRAPLPARPSAGFGLESMRFRLSLVGGDLSLVSTDHFRMLVRIPLSPELSSGPG